MHASIGHPLGERTASARCCLVMLGAHTQASSSSSDDSLRCTRHDDTPRQTRTTDRRRTNSPEINKGRLPPSIFQPPTTAADTRLTLSIRCATEAGLGYIQLITQRISTTFKVSRYAFLQPYFSPAYMLSIRLL